MMKLINNFHTSIQQVTLLLALVAISLTVASRWMRHWFSWMTTLFILPISLTICFLFLEDFLINENWFALICALTWAYTVFSVSIRCWMLLNEIIMRK